MKIIQLLHVNDPVGHPLYEDEVDGGCAASGEGGQDADQGRAHHATGEQAPTHLTSSFSHDRRQSFLNSTWQPPPLC